MQPILKATEKACAALVTSIATTNNLVVNVYTGIGNQDKDAPACICIAESGREEFPNSGIYHVVTRIQVKEMAKDTDVNSSLATTIFSGILTDTISNDLINTGPNYFVYDVFIQDVRDGHEDDAWVQEYVLDIVCATSP